MGCTVGRNEQVRQAAPEIIIYECLRAVLTQSSVISFSLFSCRVFLKSICMIPGFAKIPKVESKVE